MTASKAIQHVYHQPQDAWYYVQGVLRYYCYKRWWLRWLLRWHIVSQYEWRKKVARPCYVAGECICCTCRTPEVFFADKSCSAGSPAYPHCLGRTPCYPRLMSAYNWYWFSLSSHESI